MRFVRKTPKILGKSQNLVHSQIFRDCQPQIYGILFNSDAEVVQSLLKRIRISRMFLLRKKMYPSEIFVFLYEKLVFVHKI